MRLSQGGSHFFCMVGLGECVLGRVQGVFLGIMGTMGILWLTHCTYYTHFTQRSFIFLDR